MNPTTFGLDIAKNVMQVHWVDSDSGEIGGEADALASWADSSRSAAGAGGDGGVRQRALLGSHAVRAGPRGAADAARQVRPFVRGNKNDAADAQAIWSAAQQPQMRWVPLKSEEQQAVLSLHRVRAQWVKVRTETVNGLRGLLYEFGVVLPGAGKRE